MPKTAKKSPLKSTDKTKVTLEDIKEEEKIEKMPSDAEVADEIKNSENDMPAEKEVKEEVDENLKKEDIEEEALSDEETDGDEEVKDSFFSTPIEEDKPKRKNAFSKFSKKQKGIILGLILLISAGAFLGSYLYYQKVKAPNEGPNPSATQKEVKSLLEKVGKLMILPSETPDIATVTDKSSLPENDFFAKAENGDKVFVYKSIKKVILYRPSANKIVDVGELSVAPSANINEPETSTPSAVAKPLKLVILNGTKVAGLAKKASDLIESDNVEVVSVGNTNDDYQNTSISSVNTSKDISESNLQDAIKALTKVDVTVEDFPEGETKPANADAVLILGQDFADQY